MVEKHHNFVSAIIYVTRDASMKAIHNIESVATTLSSEFTLSEIICCFDGGTADVPKNLLQALESCDCTASSIIKMGKEQGLESAMNAGVDAAVGDYLLEIDDPSTFDCNFIIEAFNECMRGADIVIGETQSSTLRSKLFYSLFNRTSSMGYRLKSSCCTLGSRRAINRIRDISEFVPYRKASYASCGLTIVGISAGSNAKSPHVSTLDLAMDSLALYTNTFYRLSFGLAVFMALLSTVELFYVLSSYLGGGAIGGWASTMVALSLGFLGVFILFTFVLKYAALILRLQMNSQNYLIEDIEKIGR